MGETKIVESPRASVFNLATSKEMPADKASQKGSSFATHLPATKGAGTGGSLMTGAEVSGENPSQARADLQALQQQAEGAAGNGAATSGVAGNGYTGGISMSTGDGYANTVANLAVTSDPKNVSDRAVYRRAIDKAHITAKYALNVADEAKKAAAESTGVSGPPGDGSSGGTTDVHSEIPETVHTDENLEIARDKFNKRSVDS